MTNPLEAATEIATRSTIFKRHETRKNKHRGDEAGKPIHPPHEPQDKSLAETVAKLNTRSTIYKTHKFHHDEMHHEADREVKHMQLDGATHHDGLIETLTHMPTESTIHRRNTRRNEFLHASSSSS
eukprot:CAMPEP_0183311018 /NCGR_PEP_ID=MMETSP0160_2-20130417/34727_1 /TAXON_ID=2839 ORGANISM="Odontella Sinensis, Strain Grunow 1884" /NCGR_SAMPLE_ID=MMETSP0160_2 /ASSEMBLY_ACC=CAM_ASM_000250 /LENGTH=125 /DNA_ID=CAMNT_0025475471 /DNA_START=94 /DNA_END=471 /DNA_ORIENTATION=+